MDELMTLQYNYSKNYREVFEDLATLLFCTELGLSSGVNRRINQKGIESDPVCIGDKVYAYQAKYYEASTKLSDRKDEIINSIQVARDKGVTDLYFFINKNEPDKDPETNEEVSYIKAIEDAARGETGQKPIQLEWWTQSKIESTISQKGSKFDYLRNIYFKDDKRFKISEFYEYANERLGEKPQNNIYDTMPLQDSYIEPYLEEGQSVRGFLEEFVQNDMEYIAVISGEPGHGKTSLCYKAMKDFIKIGWLAGKVSNVFCFSLNPAGLSGSVYADCNFVLSPLLSWGGDRVNDKFTYKDCKDALIFFDGFDELLEKYLNFNYSQFFRSINDFQRQTKSHVIITSRNIAVTSKECNDVLYRLSIHTHSLQYITKQNQESWISSLKEYLEKNDPEKAREVGEYLSFYKQMDVEDDIRSLFGIPRIFRMVVNELIRPQKGNPFTDFYERLFDVNWAGRKRSDPYTEEDVKEKLQDYALSIFMSDSTTVEIDIKDDASWVFSYYMKNYSDGKVGFLNDGFYRFFLAKKIFSWYRCYSNGDVSGYKRGDFQKDLLNLARNKLDMKTIEFIKELFGGLGDCQRKRVEEKSFREAYDILKALPVAIKPVSHNSEIIEKYDETQPVEQANIFFYNIVSIGSACGQRVSVHNTDIKALRYYDLSGCILNNANLSNVDLRGVFMKAADLKKVDFSDACLRGADFSRADLSGAIFADADLRGADFMSGIDKEDVNSGFIETKLCGTTFQKAMLQGADFNGANLSDADFRESDIKGANFVGAYFERTKFTKDTEGIDCLNDINPDGIEWS